MVTGGAGTDALNFGDGTGAAFGDDEVTDVDFADGDLISIDAAGVRSDHGRRQDDGSDTVLDFGFGTIQLDGVTGGANGLHVDRRHQRRCRRYRYRDRVIPGSAGRRQPPRSGLLAVPSG